LDIEVTANRWGFYRAAANKVQIGPVRFSWWTSDRVPKHAISVEIGWRLNPKG
jgi:hypothetical protein